MNPMRHFVATLLERQGAVVEPIEPDGLEVLAPPSLRQALGLEEWSRLGFGEALPPDALRVSPESHWMERFERVLSDRGRFATRVLAPANLPSRKPETVLEQGFELTNAVYRLERVEPAWTRYQIHTFRSTAVSDERRDDCVRVGFNLANGATLDALMDAIDQALLEPIAAHAAPAPPDSVLPARWTRQRTLATLERALEPRVQAQLGPFLASMRRRQERDLARLRDYYEGLRRESLERRARRRSDQNAEEASGRERARLDAITREYRAKVADLRQKYAVKVELHWVQTLELVTPVHRFELTLRRRKGQRRFFLDWSPLARRLEQAPCEHAHTPDRLREVCDEALHLVSPQANGACPQCGARFCRACHPAGCPRCGTDRVAEQQTLPL